MIVKSIVFILLAGLPSLCLPAQAGNSAAREETKFTSLYTDTKKGCKEEASELFACKGYGGYRIVMNYHGQFASGRIESVKPGYTLDFASMQSLGWQPTVEWRMADGKPFAVIVRVDERDLSKFENTGDLSKIRKIGELLLVKGLKGFEALDEAVNARTVKANEKARRIADQGYTEIKSGKKASEEKGVKEVAVSFFTAGFYVADEMKVSETGDWGAAEIFLTQTSDETFALVNLAQGETMSPVLVKAKISGAGGREIQLAMPATHGGHKFKGKVTANGIKMNDGRFLKRTCGSLFSNLASGESGDAGGVEIFLLEAGGKRYALVTLAEGITLPPVLTEMKTAGSKSEIQLPANSSGERRKFAAVITADADSLTLFENGDSWLLKAKCYE